MLPAMLVCNPDCDTSNNKLRPRRDIWFIRICIPQFKPLFCSWSLCSLKTRPKIPNVISLIGCMRPTIMHELYGHKCSEPSLRTYFKSHTSNAMNESGYSLSVWRLIKSWKDLWLREQSSKAASMIGSMFSLATGTLVVGYGPCGSEILSVLIGQRPLSTVREYTFLEWILFQGAVSLQVSSEICADSFRNILSEYLAWSSLCWSSSCSCLAV
jgi:hypothetical protein